MKYLKIYKIFESEIFGQKEGFSNQYILSNIKDILLELEDIDMKCRIITNDRKLSDVLTKVYIEIEYDLSKKKDRLVFLREVLDQLKSYSNINSGEFKITHRDEAFVCITIKFN